MMTARSTSSHRLRNVGRHSQRSSGNLSIGRQLDERAHSCSLGRFLIRSLSPIFLRSRIWIFEMGGREILQPAGFLLSLRSLPSFWSNFSPRDFWARETREDIPSSSSWRPGCRFFTSRSDAVHNASVSSIEAAASTIFESWLPMDSEIVRKDNCNAREGGARFQLELQERMGQTTLRLSPDTRITFRGDKPIELLKIRRSAARAAA